MSSMSWLSSEKLHGFWFETYFLYFFFLAVSGHVLSADLGQAISRAGYGKNGTLESAVALCFLKKYGKVKIKGCHNQSKNGTVCPN